jgi:hypothetical protein
VEKESRGEREEEREKRRERRGETEEEREKRSEKIRERRGEREKRREKNMFLSVAPLSVNHHPSHASI